MIQAGRRLRLRTRLSDRPGSLHGLLAKITYCQANVISIYHDRTNPLVPIKQAVVELVLETRDKRHIETIMASLERFGYQVLNDGQ